MLIVPDLVILSDSCALMSNEEMHKIEKTSTSLSSPWQTIQSATNCWSFAIKSSMFGFRVGNHMSVKSPGVGKCSTPGRAKFANAPPPGLTRHANAPQLPGGGGDGHSWN